ncbi:PhnD/SsuA/transferrin family substrate-binding protein [Candidatus Dependentiae bacterium]|nr:PhnD/SsuA/transferrin family substrate-binding protein [Candidatus Dependentiae bacterium]
MKVIKLSLLVFICLALCCERSPENNWPKYKTSPSVSEKVYCFAVHPLHNPAKLTAVYQPLMDYLNKKFVDVRFELESSRDYANFEGKIKARKPEFILPNPWQTLEAMKVGYKVIAMAGDKNDFKGIFIVRKNSGIKEPADLKGKSVSYPSPTALAACIMPQYFLYLHGINVMKEIKNVYVGSQESSIMNVYLNKTAAGATWPPPWRAFQKTNPKEASEMYVIWETPYLINNSVMAKGDIPIKIIDQLCSFLFQLRDTQEGRKILSDMETAGFYAATDNDYDIVKSYIIEFEKKVRKVINK